MCLELQLLEEKLRENITAHANSQGLVEERAGGQRKANHVKSRRGVQKEASPSSGDRSRCLIRCWEQWYKTLLLPFLANARAFYTGAGGSGGFPCATAAWATPSAHAYRPLRSPPQQIHPGPNVTEDEMQENPLINLNRGSLISPPKAFPPHLLGEGLEGSERMGPSLSVSACIPRRSVWSPRAPQLAPLPQRPGHNSHFMNGKRPRLYLAAAWSQRAGEALLTDFKGLEQACLVMFTAQCFAEEAKKAPSGSFLKPDGLSRQPQ